MRQALHRRLQPTEGAGDVPIDQPGDDQGQAQDGPADRTEANDRGAHSSIHVVEVGAGDKHQVPWGKPLDIRDLRLPLRLPRLGECVGYDASVGVSQRVADHVGEQPAVPVGGGRRLALERG